MRRSGRAALTSSTAFLTLSARGVRVGTEVREGDHRGPRLDVEAAHGVGRQDRDLGQLLGRRVDVDRRVGEEEGPVLQHQDVEPRDALDARRGSQDLERGPDRVGVGLRQAGDHAVGVARVEHQRTEDVAHARLLGRVLGGHPVAAAQLLQARRVDRQLLRPVRVHELDALHRELQVPRERLDLGLAREQDRPADPLLGQDLRGAQNLGMLAIREHDPLGVALRLLDHRAHDLPRPREQRLQSPQVGAHVRDRLPRDAGPHRRLRHGRRHPQQDAIVEGLGDEVVPPESERLPPVGLRHRVGHVHLGERGQRLRRGALHRLVDLGRADVERAPEDEREPEHVVDLVGIVAPPRRDEHVRTGRPGLLGSDLRVRVGQREDDRVARHGLEHLSLDDAPGRKADEGIRARQRVLEGALRGLDREFRLVRIHVVRAAEVDDAGPVHHPQVLALHAVGHVELGARDRRRARAAEDDLDVVDLLADDLERVQERRRGDDRGAVLVVVEHRDLQALLQALLDLEALGRLDVLEVDPAEGRRDARHRLDEGVDVERVHLDVEHVDVGEALEEHALALHDGLGGERSDVAQAEHRGAVGDHGDQVALGRVLVDLFGIPRDLQAWFGHSRAVRQREVLLGPAGLRRDDFDLPLAPAGVILERFLRRGFSHYRRGGGKRRHPPALPTAAGLPSIDGCPRPRAAATRPPKADPRQ